MKYSFIHISDLHYRPDWPEENELVCNRFFEDLKDQIKNIENPHLIFSGDIVFAGANPHLYDKFHNNFAMRLDEVGIRKERRICIPGNHDVSREALKPMLTIQKGSLSEIADERAFNDNLSQFSKLFLAGNFENYKTYESTFARYTSCALGLGGTGWELADGIGLYCLNTALGSFGGIEDINGKPISDQNQLMIDTRSLYRWLEESSHAFRILVMHHPLDWLAPWAKTELQKIIQNSFKLVFSGHVHENAATFSSPGVGGSLNIVAPPLFTRKHDQLGYSILTLDIASGLSEVVYRQWSQTQRFVPGTGLVGNETGKLSFPFNTINSIPLEVIPQILRAGDTLSILQAEFDEARICYSSKKLLWVDRDLSSIPENGPDSSEAVFESPTNLAKSPRSCIIRSPKQFGLTCLGRFLAVEHYRQSAGTALVMLDTGALPHHRQGIIDHIEDRCNELKIQQKSIAGFLLDNWISDKGTRRLLRELRSEFKNIPVIILAGVDDCEQIANAMEIEEESTFKTLYLWALSRHKIRELTVSYVHGMDSLDDDLVTKKVTDDIDALNIHRTPLNCLLILKLAE